MNYCKIYHLHSKEGNINELFAKLKNVLTEMGCEWKNVFCTLPNKKVRTYPYGSEPLTFPKKCFGIKIQNIKWQDSKSDIIPKERFGVSSDSIEIYSPASAIVRISRNDENYSDVDIIKTIAEKTGLRLDKESSSVVLLTDEEKQMPVTVPALDLKFSCREIIRLDTAKKPFACSSKRLKKMIENANPSKEFTITTNNGLVILKKKNKYNHICEIVIDYCVTGSVRINDEWVSSSAIVAMFYHGVNFKLEMCRFVCEIQNKDSLIDFINICIPRCSQVSDQLDSYGATITPLPTPPWYE